MEVTLTIQNEAGELGHVSAVGDDYDSAYAAAQELVPEDCRAIAIRTGRY